MEDGPYLQSLVPLLGELWSASNSLMPDHWEVCHRTEILCHSNSVVEVQHHMPPPPRNKHCLPCLLQYLQLKREGRRSKHQTIHRESWLSTYWFKL